VTRPRIGTKASDYGRSWVPLQFNTVTVSELVKTLGNMPVPAAKFRARRSILDPFVEVDFFLPQAPWPKAVN
jgi:hypothetical protein